VSSASSYKISAEVVTQNVRNGLLPVFAQSAGQTWFRVADVVALFGTSKYTSTEQE
jgi:hypothetical protein